VSSWARSAGHFRSQGIDLVGRRAFCGKRRGVARARRGPCYAESGGLARSRVIGSIDDALVVAMKGSPRRLRHPVTVHDDCPHFPTPIAADDKTGVDSTIERATVPIRPPVDALATGTWALRTTQPQPFSGLIGLARGSHVCRCDALLAKTHKDSRSGTELGIIPIIDSDDSKDRLVLL
jgi:hypothetical protein